MTFCSRLVPYRLEEQALSALVEGFLQTKLVTILGIDPFRSGIDPIRSGVDPVRYKIFSNPIAYKIVILFA